MFPKLFVYGRRLVLPKHNRQCPTIIPRLEMLFWSLSQRRFSRRRRVTVGSHHSILRSVETNERTGGFHALHPGTSPTWPPRTFLNRRPWVEAPQAKLLQQQVARKGSATPIVEVLHSRRGSCRNTKSILAEWYS